MSTATVDPCCVDARLASERGSVFVGRCATIAVAACVLLVAAVMKIFDPGLDARSPWNSLAHPSVAAAIVTYEVILGFWLISGLWWRLAWDVALCTFALFLAVSVYKGLDGAESCGCFGVAQVNPWVTAALDASLVAALMSLRSRHGWVYGESQASKTSPRVVAAIVGATLTGWIGFQRLPTALPDRGDLSSVQPGAPVLLEPAKWIGKHFPLTPYVDVGESVRTGQCLVMLYHADCPVCVEAIPFIRRLGVQSALKVVLIEMPPHGHKNLGLSPHAEALVHGKLSDDREWFATTPVVMSLDGGVVNGVLEGKAVFGLRPGKERQEVIGFDVTVE